MADTARELREAIAEAVNESKFLEEELAEEPTDPFGTPSDDSLTEGDDLSTGDDQSRVVSEAEEGTDEEPPTTYWGTSLEGLSAEQRKEVIAALEQRDSLIQQLQQKIATKPESTEPEVPAEPEVEITDDDILRAIGIDPEGDPFEVEYARKHTLPLARQVMVLEDQVSQVVETEQIQTAATQWNQQLDQLEKEYGELPLDRTQVLQYAVNEGINSPEVLYFRLTAPVRKQIDEQVAKIRKQTAKKQAAGGLRPRATEAGAKVIEMKDKSLRDIVKEAAIAAQEETGYKWQDLLRG